MTERPSMAIVYKTNLISIIADNDRLGKISAKSINLI